ncbi:MAG: TonB-dependent receptor [Opitutaceae bacterium]|nr:TonB-dependent receptor [Opitutaceae bacterium]
MAAAPATRSFDIPAGDATQSLRLAAQQAGREIMFLAETVRGTRTAAVKGEFTAEDALRRMIAGTNLQLVQDSKSGALAIARTTEPAERPKALAAPRTESASARPAATQTGHKEDEGTITLPKFSVSSTKANEYRATDSLSAARIRGALIDTPATINVITREFLEDIGANSMFDATQYVSGIGNGRLGGTNGILDRQTIRGFESDGRTIDNLKTGFQANLNPTLYERVEIVKGPNAILAPTGAPGGSLNVITKSPLFTRLNTATLQVGNVYAQKFTIDSTGPLASSPRIAYRFIGGYQDADTYVPGKLKQWDLNPQFTYKFSDRSAVTLKYSYISWDSAGAASNPGTVWIAGPEVTDGMTIPNDPPPGLARRGYNGVPAWAHRYDWIHRSAAEFTTALTERINMRIAGQYIYDKMSLDGGQAAYPNINANHINPFTGAYTPNQTWARNTAGTFVPSTQLQYDPTRVAVNANLNPNWTHNAQIQNDFAGRFVAGPVSLQPVMGWTYERNLSRGINKTAPLPAINLFAPDNNPPKPPESAYTNVGTNNQSASTTKQAYAALRGGFFADRVFLSSGVARVWNDSTVTDLRNGNTTPGAPLRGHRDTYLAGFLVKLAPNVSTYYSFSSNAQLASFNNQPIWREGKQHEFGAKAEFFDQRLSVSGSHFQIRQTNLATPNPLFLVDPVNNPSNILSSQTNQGFEFDVVGGLTKELTILASYTRMHTRDQLGRRPRNIPDTTANALLKYDFRAGNLKGVGAFVGITHTGNSAGESPPGSGLTPLGVVAQVSFYVPERTILNAGASYAWNQYRFNLNVENVANKRTVWQGSGRNSLSPFPSTAVRLTTTLRF